MKMTILSTSVLTHFPHSILYTFSKKRLKQCFLVSRIISKNLAAAITFAITYMANDFPAAAKFPFTPNCLNAPCKF